jgi:hypothetical protein
MARKRCRADRRPPAGFIVLRTHVSKAIGSECMARFLPSRYKVSYVLARSRYKAAKRAENISRCRILINVHWRSIAVQSPNEATFESRCRSLLACSGAYPGTTCMINFLESRIKRKNCDKKMTFIVRVSKRSVI